MTFFLAEIVFPGSQFITKFDQIFYHTLTDMILLFLLFFMTLFQDNHKLVKARFVRWVVGWRLNEFSLRVVSGILPAMFYLRTVHTFSWFFKSNWSSDFGHAETGNGAKKRGVLRREFFCSNFKVDWENGVWTKIRFLGSGFLFTCGNFTLIFTVFSIFRIGFFSKCFSQSIHSHSRPSFLFELNFYLALVVFCVHMLHFDIDFLFFFLFFIWFFSKYFLNQFIVHSRSFFLFSQWKFFEL